MAISKDFIVKSGLVVTSPLGVSSTPITTDESGKVVLPNAIILEDGSDIPKANLVITPESLAIQVDAVMAGDDMPWVWTWENSSLPFARTPITNSFQLSVPLYEDGNYTISNFTNTIHGMLDQTHGASLKWVDGAGFDNEISWASTKSVVSESHPDINGGVAIDVQKITINLPTNITPPVLTAPSGIGYMVSHATAGSYTFGASNVGGGDLTSVVEGDNPNIGPMYRGSTYTFTLDASLAGHPFYLSTDNGANYVSGSYVGEYVTGVTGSRNDGSTGKTTLSFAVPADAPDNLYYQCGNHSSMRGVITIKDLAVEVNDAGNFVVYFQHTHEGMKTPIELRPLPTLVNQMCLVYDASNNQFVPQDLATYVENTPSFKNKIKEVAGTATLVAADGTSLVASIKLYEDASYLPYVSNKGGDLAYAKDTKYIYIWDVITSGWEVTGTNVASVTGLQGLLDGYAPQTTTYTKTEVDTKLDLKLNISSNYSDYRLKENVVPLSDPIDRLVALNPSRFNFISDPEIVIDGFLAHEAQEIVPESVIGTKDATRTEVYEISPGVNAERQVPVYQVIDLAKIVPLLVASVQEQQKEIDTLKTLVQSLL